MADLPGVITDLGPVRGHTVAVAEEIAARWDLTFIWGYADKPGEHGKGRALDFMGFDGGTVANPGPMRPQVCQQIANYLWEHRARLGVWYVIWNRQIISITYEDQGWRPYSGASPHTDHVHVSLLDDPPVYVAPDDGDGMELSDQVKLPKWIPARWPDSSALADGQIAVNTALGSGYGHARVARENTEKILALLAAHNATIDRLLDALDWPESDVAELKAAIAEAIRTEFGRISLTFDQDIN